jgi:hypothetical protein
MYKVTMIRNNNVRVTIGTLVSRIDAEDIKKEVEHQAEENCIEVTVVIEEV